MKNVIPLCVSRLLLTYTRFLLSKTTSVFFLGAFFLVILFNFQFLFTFFKNVQVSALPDRDSNKASTVVLAF